MSEGPLAKLTGSCLCGEIKFEVDGPMRAVRYCHCEQCCKTSGHFVAATACADADLVMRVETGLRWYQSSADAKRGFCGNCGSSVFWRPNSSDKMHVMAGCIDAPTGLHAEEHIYVAQAADYYSIDDGLPQFPEYNPAHTVL
jgi:hypothetical protein